MSRRSAILLLLLAALLMGTASTAAALVPATVPSPTLGAVGLGCGGLLLLAVFPRRSARVVRDRSTRPAVLLGAVLVCGYALSYYTSIRYCGVAVSTVVNLGTAPLFTALIERARGRRGFSSRWTIGTLISITGLVVLAVSTEPAAGRGEATPAGDMLIGVGLATLAGLLYAGYTHTSKHALEHGAHPSGVMGATFGGAGILLLPFLIEGIGPLVALPGGISLAIYLAVVPVFLGFWLFGLALAHVEARTATTVTLVEPVLASALAARVVHEHIAPLGWVGVAAVVLGLSLATRLPAAPVATELSTPRTQPD
ncbi:DMT family transporter [Microbacterium sp. NPDC056044]|uniref:DMT family transporter n=1 Tax=Microbacterium sp. NPDC056044 TaxID=3345690 RepID=UPI0035DE0377